MNNNFQKENAHPDPNPEDQAPPVPPLKIIEPDPPLPDYSLEQFSSPLQETIKKMGWNELMPVQVKAIPYILNAMDLIVQSKTGSGKTGGFILPLLEIIEKEHLSPQALILVPTRELAQQVFEEAVKFGTPLGIKSVSVYGGVGYATQMDAFRQGVHIVIGTPGRMLDHLIKGSLKLDSVRDLVIDEADEMLSMGFYPDMKKIHGFLPRDRCTYLFSATMPANVVRLSKEFMNAPRYLSLSVGDDVSVSSMDHVYYVVDPMEKDKSLNRLIEWENPDSALIFCNTRRDVNYVYEYLKGRGHQVGILSGDIKQNIRQRMMTELKNGSIRFIVATDVAARGIDVQGLSHVFMYDHPEDPETYVHRSGRTARAGNYGKAVSVVSVMEEAFLKRTASQFGILFTKKELPDDNQLDAMVRERATVSLEQDFRYIKQAERMGSKRMIPLLDSMMESEEEKEILGLLLYRYYWKKFTRNPSIFDENESSKDEKPSEDQNNT